MLSSAADRLNSAGKRMLVSSPTTAESQKRLRHSAAANVVCGLALTAICILAFSLRLFSVIKYESVIHEFDPYFNYRVTQFLTKEGFYNLWNWFDDRTWYPLGRVVGGTVYPVRIHSHQQCKRKLYNYEQGSELLLLAGLDIHSRRHVECFTLFQHSNSCPGGRLHAIYHPILFIDLICMCMHVYAYVGMMWHAPWDMHVLMHDGFPMQVCVFTAPLFSAFCALTTYFLTKEVRNQGAGLFAALFAASVPSYISRSVAGSYDNEGVAIFALVLVFFLYVKVSRQRFSLHQQ